MKKKRNIISKFERNAASSRSLMESSVAAFRTVIDALGLFSRDSRFLKNLSLALCLKLLAFLVDFRLDCRVFQILGPR